MTRINEIAQQKNTLASSDLFLIEDGADNYITKKTTGQAIAGLAPVQSVAGKTGNVTVTKDDVGLGNIVNSDTTNASNITSGTLAAGRLPSVNIGTTSVDLTRASGSLSLTGVSIDGNAGTVTNGIYTTGSYSDPSWLTISKSKVGLANVENTALSTWGGSTNITTLGTVSTGTVPIANVSGGAPAANPTFTGVVTVPAGTAAAPSVAITGDTNTGLYSPGTDQIALATGGTGQVFVDASGNVGIGTSGPGAKLDIASAGEALRLSGSTNAAYIRSVASGVNQWFIGSGGSSGIQVYTYTADPISFSTNSTERLRIDSSGRLLVGTSSARGGFFGDATVIPGFQMEGTQAYNDYRRHFALTHNATSNNGPFLHLAKTRGSALGSVTVVQNGDELGTLAFLGSDGTSLIPGATIAAAVDGTPGTNNMPGRLVFSTTADGASSPTERMRIDSAGLITAGSGGVNGMQALSLLTGQVNTSGALLTLRTANDGNGGYYQAMRNGAGNIIGTISQSGSTGVAYNTSSDYRLKENISSISDGIARLLNLKPSRFNFIADPNRTVDGFIAHEVQAVIPEAVTGEKDAVDEEGKPIYQGIDQSKLVPLLTAALQEAIHRIESLEATVATLTA